MRESPLIRHRTRSPSRARTIRDLRDLIEKALADETVVAGLAEE
jgi:hypothetical protein